MKRLICRLRRHRPVEKIGENRHRCKCGSVEWEGPLDVMVMPGAGLVFGYRRVKPGGAE